MAMQSLTVDLDGPYHYADHGGDGPPMVLLHGIGGSHLNWMSVAPTLAQSFHVYALDMIGFGFTPNGRRDSKLPTQARYVDRFIGEVAGAPAVVTTRRASTRTRRSANSGESAQSGLPR